jgi:uncharacterized protein with WD repeat
MLLGASMQPHLDGLGDARPAGPQTLMAGKRARAAGPFGPGAIRAEYSRAEYSDQPPDYVTGADARKAASWPRDEVAASAREIARQNDPPMAAAAAATRADYDEPPPGAEKPGPDDAGASGEDAPALRG